MNFYKNEILLSIEAPFYGAIDFSKEFIKQIKPFSYIIKISSAYKVQSRTKPDSEAKVVFSIHVRTSLIVEKFLEQIKNIETKIKFKLLTYNQEVSMTPQLTLPHPDLISENILLYCSAEIMPEYVHPILKQELGVLSLRHEFTDDAEFYLQGKTFLE